MYARLYKGILSAFLAALLGCQGIIQSDGISDGRTAGSGEKPGTEPQIAPPNCDAPWVDLAPTQRLTRTQYDRTASDLLGIASTEGRGFAPDNNTDGYDVGHRVSALLAEQYFDAAERLAARAVQENFDDLVPCAGGGDDAACVQSFVERFAKRAYRRPVSLEEKTSLVELYENGATLDFSTGIENVIFGVLASPHFLYRIETPAASAAAGDHVAVEPYALASRLSYFLWGTLPDEVLLDAAGSGELSGAGLETQVRRMIADDRAVRGLHEFSRQWLHLDSLDSMTRDAAVYPKFSEQVATRLRGSVDAFVDHAFRSEGATIETLLTSDKVYLDAALADVLEIPGVSSDTLEAVSRPEDRRKGILSQPGLLAVLSKTDQSDPVHRGVFVRKSILCQPLPPPPNDIAIAAPDPAPGLTTRERFAEHSSNDACRGCHELIDPLGFGFEHYDAIGRWRSEDNGAPVDASGEVVGTDTDGTFYGAPELADQLAESEQVRECLALQWYRYAVGRTDNAADTCSVRQLHDRFRDANYDLRELLLAVALTDSFKYIQVPEGMAL